MKKENPEAPKEIKVEAEKWPKFDITKRRLKESGIPSKYLPKVFEEHFKKKAWMLDTFGFNAGNEYRVLFKLNEELNTRPDARAVMDMIELFTDFEYTRLDQSFMWKGKTKVKVTKVLSKVWPKLMQSDACKMFVARCLGRFYDPGIGGVYSHDVNVAGGVIYHTDDTLLHMFQVWYGDYVKNGRVGVLSINPFDFFTCSDRDGKFAAFSSCLRPGGEYFNTVPMYLNSPHILIMYTTEPHRIDFKMGRCWVYAHEDAVFHGRRYGSIFDPDVLLVRDWMQERLGGGTWTRRSDGLLQSDYVRPPEVSYVDVNVGDFTYRKGAGEIKKFMMDNPICLSCGKEYRSGHDGGIGSCCHGDSGRRRCLDCGNTIRGDVYWYNDDAYCESCHNERFCECDVCDTVLPRDETFECFDSYGEALYVCQDCKTKHTFTCAECGKLHVEEPSKGTPRYVPLDGSDKPLCFQCSIKTMDFCYKCHTWVKQGTATKVADAEQTVCERCVDTLHVCRYCKKQYMSRRMYELCESACRKAAAPTPTISTTPNRDSGVFWQEATAVATTDGPTWRTTIITTDTF